MKRPSRARLAPFVVAALAVFHACARFEGTATPGATVPPDSVRTHDGGLRDGGVPPTEPCDIAEGVAETACGSSVGECQMGVMLCAAGFTACAGAIGPAIELCDELDNDCDETIDEDFSDRLGTPCSVGMGACEQAGEYQCSADRRSVLCSAEPRAARDEHDEPCNGVDDDCDGLADYFIDDDGSPRSVCRCEPLPIVAMAARPDTGSESLCDGSLDSLSCSADARGFAMDFCMEACTDNFWAQCIYEGVSLNGFDADHEGQGLLEVAFETSAELSAAINAYYGNYPKRKILRLWAPTEQQPVLPAGLYRKLFLPEDAECPTYPAQDADLPPDCAPSGDATIESCIPRGCRQGCTDGSWATDDDTECRFSYDAVPLWLAFESCWGGAGTQRGRITLLSVTHHSGSCICSAESSCKDSERSRCDLTVLAGERGVCVP